jgi:hypothetical protein
MPDLSAFKPLFAALRHPELYTFPAAYLVSAYLFWRQGKRQYWDTRVIFNMVGITTLLAIVAWATMVQIESRWSTVREISHVQPALITTIALSGLWFYTRRVRYPWRRVADVGAAAGGCAMSILSMSNILNGALVPIVWLSGSVILIVVLIFLRASIKTDGRAAGMYLCALALLSIATVFMRESAWQQRSTLIELFLYGCGVIGGIVLIINSGSAYRQMHVWDLPRGVSQGFRDTFSRAFAPKREPS